MPEDINQTNQPEGAGAPPAPPAAPAQDEAKTKEATWAKVDAVIVAAKKAFMGGSTLADILGSMIGTFQDMQTEETQQLGGLQQQGMELPAPPPPGEAPLA